MAEPGDPRKPEDDFDDLVGFRSPQSIAGRLVSRESGVMSVGSVAHMSAPSASFAVESAGGLSAAPSSRDERRRILADEPKDRLTWALTLYGLILLAVPTLGFSAVLGILAVTGRATDASPFLTSHYVYQRRTLWGAAIAALVGLILIVVNLGVFVLFVLALWTIARGAVGVWRLKNAQPISNPGTWFV